MTRLKDCTSEYSGGLDCASDKDGEFAYMWRGDVTHVVYHVATLMPSREDDKQVNPCFEQRVRQSIMVGK